MFEAAELGRKVDKAAFAAAMPELRLGLLEAQRRAREAGVPVVILIAGVSGAGKGQVVNRLLEWLDSRGVQVQAYWDETDEELQRPRWWRYWRTLPPAGSVGVLFGAWYTPVLLDQIAGRADAQALAAEITRIVDTERTLVRAGVLVLKFWCHLPEKEQAKRIKERRKDPESHWRMAPETVRYANHYKDFVRVGTQVLRETDTGDAPWYLIEATDRRYRDLTIGRTLLKALQARLDAPPAPEHLQTSHAPVLPDAPSARVTVLDHVDLDSRLERDDYRQEMDHWQAEVNRLTWKAFRARRPCVALFEGWDAAGKGGAIRRLIQSMDARLYTVVPIAAPTDEERAHHYLWRFWRHIPRDGYCALFDRSWYGRVLVERVEGFAAPVEWARAYHEINDFEAQLAEHGVVITKFWLHIDKEEQLQRFKAREQTPYKQHKITPDDWRNRDRWDDYKAAVNEMVVRTSTEYAPWEIVPANDKHLARVTVLKTFARRLKDALDD
ncbi:polyphosphate:AMP phosphotransferase [Acidihalobacter prosperus]|uniref:Polyphosphate:AMP phosphotransferase n=1 Tax=Acidihalobacter prosperus TaxID=160660 RepID=A0A1A6C4X6_9GAMM|nr:polyphosphate:AMP phosphotransferase [Acidihalobacter prosperus]OBS09604.1 polyphosphate:AMP phosphotransferase [Acidihalobacter prosperus]